MAHPYWPLFDVEVRTPRLTLRYVDDHAAVELARLAASGIHDAGYMPFAAPWSTVPPPMLERNTLQYYWRTRADLTEAAWEMQFAAIADGTTVGTTSLIATDFPTTRTFETGSWLGRQFQGGGLGTELRIAALHLGFLALDATEATTGAFHDNAASLGVTAKLGYQPNGIHIHARTGERTEAHRFRMSRQHFVDNLQRDDIEIVVDDRVRALLGISRPGERLTSERTVTE